MTPRMLRDALSTGDNLQVVDVREDWEIALCSIPGSRHLPMGAVPSGLDTLDRERPIVVVCHHGLRSLQVSHYLERSGFVRVINLTGGIDAWAQEVDPHMTRY